MPDPFQSVIGISQNHTCEITIDADTTAIKGDPCAIDDSECFGLGVRPFQDPRQGSEHNDHDRYGNEEARLKRQADALGCEVGRLTIGVEVSAAG